MNNNKTTTTGGNATPTLDSLQEFLREKRKPKSVSLANTKKCLVITEPGSYIGVPVKVQPSGDQLAVTFNIFDVADPNVRYHSVRFWLNSEYADGDVEDDFFQTFDNPESSDDIIGKSCGVEIDFVEKLDGSRVYPRIIAFSKLD